MHGLLTTEMLEPEEILTIWADFFLVGSETFTTHPSFFSLRKAGRIPQI